MRLDRLARMGLREAAARSRQVLRKRLDRIAAGPAPAAPPRPGAAVAATRGARHAAQGASTRPAPRLVWERFHAGATDPGTPARVRALAPFSAARTIATAGAVLRGRFDLLGYRGLRFGDPPDWSLDPVSGRRAPLRHWSRIDPLSPDLGDPKVIWEMSRHAWLVTLGQAWRMTGDARYARRIVETIEHWTAANPYGWGLHWTSSLEAAIRLVAWCWALALTAPDGGVTAEEGSRVALGIRRHARHVETYLSRYSSPNTHLTGEAIGLYCAGTLLPSLAEAERWRDLGERILLEEIDRQVLPDGVYFERAACYQRYTLEILVAYLLLAERSGRPAPARVGEAVQSMLEAFLPLLRRDGTVPPFGDSDGGRLLPLEARRTEDVRGLFSTAAVLFRRGDFAWAAGRLAPETLWLLGPGAERAFAAVPPSPPPGPASRLLPSGGYAVMRSGWTGRDQVLMFDVGPLGARGAAGHAHADLLSIDVAALGVPCVVDPGTYLYAAGPAWREHFRGTAAHSTVTVDGRSQAETRGPFGWRSLPAARLRLWRSNDRFDLADAEHDAYARPGDEIVHRRRVMFVKPDRFAILDEIRGASAHRVEARLQLAPSRAVRLGGGWFRMRTPGGAGLLVGIFPRQEGAILLEEGMPSPPRGFIAPAYGRLVPAPAITAVVEAPLPVSILTLLVAAPAEGPPPDVEVTWDGSGGPTARLDACGPVVRFPDEGIVFEGGMHA